MLAAVIMKLPDWLWVLSRKWATLLPARSVNKATPVLPLEKVMLIGPKSLPLITDPAGYSSPFMMK